MSQATSQCDQSSWVMGQMRCASWLPHIPMGGLPLTDWPDMVPEPDTTSSSGKEQVLHDIYKPGPEYRRVIIMEGTCCCCCCCRPCAPKILNSKPLTPVQEQAEAAAKREAEPSDSGSEPEEQGQRRRARGDADQRAADLNRRRMLRDTLVWARSSARAAYVDRYFGAG